MTRLFDEHVKRRVASLDGSWTFCTDRENKGECDGWYKSALCGRTVIVPSVWNTAEGLLEYEGVCWYEKSFYTEGGTLRLSFGAVMTYAKVYFDGEYLGDHYGGFTSFDFILNNVSKGNHRLTVRVDNSFDEDSIPQIMVDWYHYGGITRSVTCETLSGISILREKFDYKLSEDDAECSLTFEAYNAENHEICDTVRIFINNAVVLEKEITLPSGERRLITTEIFALKNVKLWSPDEPNLYSLKTETSHDDLYDRVGFRFIEVRDKAIYLNGKKIKLLGVNRHEDHPDFGMAFPPHLMQRDVDLILKANCNSIRGSHYPNSKIFIDMLDEAGITFWSEIPIWGVGFSPKTLGRKLIVERGLKMHEEMIWQYYNHPSIIIWGMHNEIDASSKEGYEMSRLYYNYLKKMGGNRIVTYAHYKYFTDISLEFCDVISINNYCGWYDYEGVQGFDDLLSKMDKRIKELGLDDKPRMITEYGAAALYGNHTHDCIPWSEEYQAKLICENMDKFFARPEYVGSYVWQFTDIRTAKEMGLNRARGFNNKGILNEYRKPKLAYDAVRDAYEKYGKE